MKRFPSNSSGLRTEKKGGIVAHMLAFVAGSVDAIGYVVLFHMFTANMSGNSAALGVELGQGHWSKILHRAFPIPVFMLGVMIGSLMIEVSARRHFKRFFSGIFLLEALLIGLFMFLGGKTLVNAEMTIQSPHFYALAALPAVAMGIQTASLHKLGTVSIRTTFVTGMITVFCREFIRYLIWTTDNSRLGWRTLLSTSPQQGSFIRMVLCGGIWLFYMTGAIFGGFAIIFWRLWALSVPIFFLFAAIALDFSAYGGKQPGNAH